ncbi:MAG: nucleotidyltransferase family protein [Chitinophagaceae bacterium]|nr:nucleotidyltransferase family protein [Chitinophagaceae bacterium]
MYTLEEIKNILTKVKPELQKKYPLSTLGIFGSYARGDANENSDIDVLVDFNDAIGGMKYISLAHEIEDLFSIKVDVVSKGGIKPKYFKYVSEDLIYV